jgi:hypothetical protein
MATQRQKAAISKIVENHGIVSKTMRQVGYSKNSARNPKNLTDSDAFKEAQPDIIQKLIIERTRATDKLKNKISKAKYRDLVDGIDKLTKNIQLLSGGKTQDITFRWDE